MEEAKRGSGGGSGVRRFELHAGRCVGCGDCVEVCPEDALMIREGVGRVGEGAEPTPRGIIELLQAVE